MSVLKRSNAAANVEVVSIGRERLWLRRVPTAVWLLVPGVLFVAAIELRYGPTTQRLLLASAVLSAVVALVAAVRTVLNLGSFVLAVTGRSDMSVLEVLAKAIGNGLMAWLGGLMALWATFGLARGRQIRRWGRVLLPSLRANDEWTRHAIAVGRTDAPAGLADQWRENGKTEHASVAAFARLTLDLMALGAPPELVAGANQDALDEIRHAQMCFSLATALDGRHVGPAPFPQSQHVATLPRVRALALAQLAVSSLVDGALHEGVSARIIARLAKRCEDEGIRAMLKSIAADEGRHSAHGWDVVEWCLDQGGSGVAEALRGALRALPGRMQAALPRDAADGGWERWGIHGHTLEDEEYGAALRHVMERVGGMLREQKTRAA